jgi:hypothetical protein
MNENIKTDVSGKWVSVNEVENIINECIGIAQTGLALAVAAVIKERFGVKND